MKLAMSLDELKRRRENGTSIRILAQLNGVDDKKIVQALEEKPEEKPNQKKIDRAKRDKNILMLYVQGFNDLQIAKKLGVSRSTVARWRKRNDKKPNGNKKEVRQKIIKRMFDNNEFVSVADTAKKLHVVPLTIYRDLEEIRGDLK